jgi:hypothetical protein
MARSAIEQDNAFGMAVRENPDTAAVLRGGKTACGKVPTRPVTSV